MQSDEISFDVREAFCILSENLTGEYIGKLLEFIEREAFETGSANRETGGCKLKGAYDGVIVTGGTDTLQYYTCACAYKFAGAQIPIMLVSSNKVLEDPASNGQTNFDHAVLFMLEKRGTGVFAVCRNSDGIIYVHRGTRLMPYLP